MALPKLGIVAGQGRLAAYLINACKATGRSFFVLALDGHADGAVLGDVPQAWIRLGDGGKGIDLLHGENVEELVFAGGVRRPSLKELRPDKRAAIFLAKLGRAWIGDNSVLSAVVREMEGEGFRVIAPETLLEEFVAREGSYGRLTPDAAAREDIERGVEVARALGSLDVGQAVIVQQRVVLGVEAAEGTDALIARCGPLHRDGPGGVLVKICKSGQERRVDLPAIGPVTVDGAAKSGLRGIAVEVGGALMFEPDELARQADAAGVFVVAIPLSA